jgi:coenzyme F420-reducing hydrogenase beta subunit
VLRKLVALDETLIRHAPTGEPVSEILIFNDQCDRIVQYLVESGQLALEYGELEDWKQRREEKTRLAQENGLRPSFSRHKRAANTSLNHLPR